MTTHSQITAQYLQLIVAGFLMFGLVFVTRDFELAETSLVRGRPSGPYGANFLTNATTKNHDGDVLDIVIYFIILHAVGLLLDRVSQRSTAIYNCCHRCVFCACQCYLMLMICLSTVHVLCISK